MYIIYNNIYISLHTYTDRHACYSKWENHTILIYSVSPSLLSLSPALSLCPFMLPQLQASWDNNFKTSQASFDCLKSFWLSPQLAPESVALSRPNLRQGSVRENPQALLSIPDGSTGSTIISRIDQHSVHILEQCSKKRSLTRVVMRKKQY